MNDMDAQDARIDAIPGDREELTFEEVVERFYDDLTQSLQLPCDVTGIEDFDWEQFYVLGPGDRKEYERLRQTQHTRLRRLAGVGAVAAGGEGLPAGHVAVLPGAWYA